MSVGTNVAVHNNRGDTLLRAEAALKIPYLGHSTSPLTAPGIEIHIPGTISHNIPLPESYQQYIELTDKMAQRFQMITQSEFQGGLILRDGNFQLVPAEVKAPYDDFVAKGYVLQGLVDQYSTDPSLSVEVRKIRDEIVLEVEKASDAKKSVDLSTQIQKLAESFVKIALCSHSTDVDSLFITLCTDIESSTPSESVYLIHEVKDKLKSIIDRSEINSEDGKAKARKWLDGIKASENMRRFV